MADKERGGKMKLEHFSREDGAHQHYTERGGGWPSFCRGLVMTDDDDDDDVIPSTSQLVNEGRRNTYSS